jgi:hypothetical protein
MLMTGLTKQLASLNATNIPGLKLMSSRIGADYYKLYILTFYQITVLLLTYSNR